MGKRAKKSKGRKGKMPEGLRRWLEAKRAGTPIGDAMKKNRKGRKSSRSGGSAKAAKRTGGRRSRGGASGGGGGLSFIRSGSVVQRARGFISRDFAFALAGGALGVLAANQIAPRIGSALDGKFGSATPVGQVAIKLAVGAAGATALSRFSKPAAVGFAIGAGAEPIAGAARSLISKQAAKAQGVSALNGLGTLAMIDDDVYETA